MKTSHVVFLVLIVFVLLIGKCSHSIYKSFDEFPDYAKQEVLNKKYETLLKSIDQAAADSSSQLNFAAKLETIEKPESLIYLALEKDIKSSFSNDKMLEVVKKFKGSSTSKVLINGTGYGQVDGQPIVVIEHPIKKFEVLNCLLFFKDEQRQLEKN